jgi:hypothetical protein
MAARATAPFSAAVTVSRRARARTVGRGAGRAKPLLGRAAGRRLPPRTGQFLPDAAGRGPNAEPDTV